MVPKNRYNDNFENVFRILNECFSRSVATQYNVAKSLEVIVSTPKNLCTQRIFCIQLFV